MTSFASPRLDWRARPPALLAAGLAIGLAIGLAAGLAALMAASGAARAQTPGTLGERTLPPLANPAHPSTPAKELFGRARDPAPMSPQAIGFYSRGCLAGASAIELDGDAWQVMRPSRNRYWGHPVLIDVVKRIARQGRADGAWPGLLVGDLSQPRGGPMLTGHSSHQIGLDADIWFTPMPERRQTRREREFRSAVNMVRRDRRDIDPRVWTEGHARIVEIAARQPEVERILVNAAIKRALCRYRGADRSWLAKVRPYWGHNYHMHLRISCPAGNASCQPQKPVAAGDGCGKELDWWFTDAVLHPKPPPKPPKPRPPVTMAHLPDACRAVLGAR